MYNASAGGRSGKTSVRMKTLLAAERKSRKKIEAKGNTYIETVAAQKLT